MVGLVPGAGGRAGQRPRCGPLPVGPAEAVRQARASCAPLRAGARRRLGGPHVPSGGGVALPLRRPHGGTHAPHHAGRAPDGPRGASRAGGEARGVARGPGGAAARVVSCRGGRGPERDAGRMACPPPVRGDPAQRHPSRPGAPQHAVRRFPLLGGGAQDRAGGRARRHPEARRHRRHRDHQQPARVVPVLCPSAALRQLRRGPPGLGGDRRRHRSGAGCRPHVDDGRHDLPGAGPVARVDAPFGRGGGGCGGEPGPAGPPLLAERGRVPRSGGAPGERHGRGTSLGAFAASSCLSRRGLRPGGRPDRCPDGPPSA